MRLLLAGRSGRVHIFHDVLRAFELAAANCQDVASWQLLRFLCPDPPFHPCMTARDRGTQPFEPASYFHPYPCEFETI